MQKILSPVENLNMAEKKTKQNENKNETRFHIWLVPIEIK